MDNFQEKGISIQDSLRNLSLVPNKKSGEQCTDSILVGKIFTTPSFRKYTLFEILNKAWKVSTQFQIDKINDNVFKIRFGRRTGMLCTMDGHGL